MSHGYRMVHSEPGKFARLNAALAQSGIPSKFVQDNGVAGLLRAPPHQKMIVQTLKRGWNLDQAEIDWFSNHGVNPVSLFTPWSVQVDRVVFDGEYFEFADDSTERGEPAYTIGMNGPLGPIDIAAWHPEREALAVWRGVGFALNERAISNHENQNSDAGGLAVFNSPWSWLRGACQGIVIIRKNVAGRLLRNVRALIAEDEQHRPELSAMCSAYDDGPRILLRASDVRLPVAA